MVRKIKTKLIDIKNEIVYNNITLGKFLSNSKKIIILCKEREEKRMERENSKIRVAICGYGNLGKGAEKAIRQNPDMELVGIFSRRPKDVLGTT